MAIKYGKCNNFGSCRLADDRVLQEADESEFVCGNPDCRSILVESRAKPLPSLSPDKSIWAIRGVLAAFAASLAGILFFGTTAEKPPGQTMPIHNVSASSPSETEPGNIPKKPLEQWVAGFNVDR